MEEIINLIVGLLVFPGFLFISLLSLLTQWFKRKITARMQHRMGPTYVGPVGLAQPLADFIKLAFVKELVIHKGFMWRLATFMVFLGISALTIITLFFPFSPYRLNSPFDVIILVYVLIYPALALILIGFLSSNPFGVIGASRNITMVLVAEPTLAITLIALSGVLSEKLPYSISEAMYTFSVDPADLIVMVPAVIALGVTIMTKSMLKPFEIPEAETELAGGFVAEVSGPLLAMVILLHDIELTVLSLITTFLILGGPYPFALWSPQGIAMVFVKYFAILFTIFTISASMGRVRIEQSVGIIIKLGFICSLIALVASFLV